MLALPPPGVTRPCQRLSRRNAFSSRPRNLPLWARSRSRSRSQWIDAASTNTGNHNGDDASPTRPRKIEWALLLLASARVTRRQPSSSTTPAPPYVVNQSPLQASLSSRPPPSAPILKRAPTLPNTRRISLGPGRPLLSRLGRLGRFLSKRPSGATHSPALPRLVQPGLGPTQNPSLGHDKHWNMAHGVFLCGLSLPARRSRRRQHHHRHGRANTKSQRRRQ
ncbi:hypothetical protein QBC39DRAFT_178619 [Podospora conica]|nr:hypothetical protein QBC39DRAFT_178619 [Schizothecium conicum]